MTLDLTLIEAATLLESIMPKLMRRLFTLEPNHPVAEMPVAQLRVCTMLQGGPRAISSIGEEIGISASAVTQIADRLEKAGLVERIAEPDDRRMKNLELTPYGAHLMNGRREYRIRRVAEALESLDPHEREMILSAFRILLEAAIETAHPVYDESVPFARLEL
jgi:DNA-binding MarR family transcriptional regulator